MRESSIERVVPLVFLAVFGVFCSSATHAWLPAYGWHDQQRVFQLLFVLFCVSTLVFLRQPALPRMALAMLFGIFVLGLVSSQLATWQGWALKEWTRFAGLLMVALVAGSLCGRVPSLVRAVLWVMVLVGGIHALQFVVAYVAVFASGLHVLDVYVLYTGFSNPRFFGQFQVLLLPVLAAFVMHCRSRRLGKIASMLALALVVQWCIAFALGGRGVWLGLVVAHLAVMLFNHRIWRLIVLQAGAGLFGFGLFLLLFKWVPVHFGVESMLVDGLRMGSSGRDQLWLWAWQMVVENPLLGVGPMHYAAVVSSIAAHPHQVLLQWMAEWGVPASLMAVVLGAWGMLHGGLYLRRAAATEVDAALWLALAGALVLAQVDGVFVMPYTETWFAVLAGLAFARWGQQVPAGSFQRAGVTLLSIPVIGVLSLVLLREAPVLPQSQATYILEQHRGGAPRFWEQGWIPMEFK